MRLDEEDGSGRITRASQQEYGAIGTMRDPDAVPPLPPSATVFPPGEGGAVSAVRLEQSVNTISAVAHVTLTEDKTFATAGQMFYDLINAVMPAGFFARGFGGGVPFYGSSATAEQQIMFASMFPVMAHVVNNALNYILLDHRSPTLLTRWGKARLLLSLPIGMAFTAAIGEGLRFAFDYYPRNNNSNPTQEGAEGGAIGMLIYGVVGYATFKFGARFIKPAMDWIENMPTVTLRKISSTLGHAFLPGMRALIANQSTLLFMRTLGREEANNPLIQSATLLAWANFLILLELSYHPHPFTSLAVPKEIKGNPAEIEIYLQNSPPTRRDVAKGMAKSTAVYVLFSAIAFSCSVMFRHLLTQNCELDDPLSHCDTTHFAADLNREAFCLSIFYALWLLKQCLPYTKCSNHRYKLFTPEEGEVERLVPPPRRGAASTVRKSLYLDPGFAPRESRYVPLPGANGGTGTRVEGRVEGVGEAQSQTVLIHSNRTMI